MHKMSLCDVKVWLEWVVKGVIISVIQLQKLTYYTLRLEIELIYTDLPHICTTSATKFLLEYNSTDKTTIHVCVS